MFQRSFQWVSNVFERSSEKFQESSNVFKESFKSAQKRYQGATRKFQGCCKNISRVFLRRLKGVSRQSQRHSKEVSRVFKESVKCVLRNFKQKVSRVFQNVSIKFCFAILFLHESHRSYPSRRRACFFCLLCQLSMAFVTVWVKPLLNTLLTPTTHHPLGTFMPLLGKVGG